MSSVLCARSARTATTDLGSSNPLSSTDLGSSSSVSLEFLSHWTLGSGRPYTWQLSSSGRPTTASIGLRGVVRNLGVTADSGIKTGVTWCHRVTLVVNSMTVLNRTKLSTLIKIVHMLYFQTFAMVMNNLYYFDIVEHKPRNKKGNIFTPRYTTIQKEVAKNLKSLPACLSWL